MTRRVVEIESMAAFDAHLVGTRRLNGWLVQSVDLSDRSVELRARQVSGAVFLGCHFAPDDEHWLRAQGALIFPRLPDLPFDPYRSRLYDAAELYGAGPYAGSPDAAIYAWSKGRGRSLTDELAATLHDHAIGDALDDLLSSRNPRLVVGVMGGHALQRGEPTYAAAAELGATLTAAGKTVLTGGGPGSMEAANLGAYLSPWPGALSEALAVLSAAPSYRPSIQAWLQPTLGLRERWPGAGAGTSVSIPTWFYGHEPTNVFATAIAKYFTNALREDTLLHRCRGGIVFLPGAAGTVQEIFQSATENYYAADATRVAPLVLVGVDYWTREYPAWPLLRRLGAGRSMGPTSYCVETVAEAAEALASTGVNP